MSDGTKFSSAELAAFTAPGGTISTAGAVAHSTVSGAHVAAHVLAAGRDASVVAEPTTPLEHEFDNSTDLGIEERNDWARAYIRRAAALDGLAALLAGLTAIVVTGVVPLGSATPGPYVAILLLVPFAWVGAVLQSHGYDRKVVGVGADEFRALPRAAVRFLALSAFISWIAYDERPYVSRFVMMTFFVALLVFSLMLRYAVRQHLHSGRWRGQHLSRTVVVGRADAVLTLIQDLQREPVHGLRPVGACAAGDLEPLDGIHVESGVHSVLESIDRLEADAVVVASPSEMTGQELRRLSWELEERGIELIVAPGIMEVAGPRLSIRPAANLSLLHVERPALHGSRALAKTAFDRAVAAVLVVVALPVLVVTAVAIKLDSDGPIFFRQKRVGAEGQSFGMLKFRSMVVDAEAQLAGLRAQADDGNGVLFKLHNDPRVTRVGAFLRRYSVDELPQLLNVLKGEMSLVGPRPPLQHEVDDYEPDAVRRLRVRPGLTGLWQVSGRSRLSWDESLRLDLRYVDNWSMMLDLQILWKTARAVFRGDGAF